MFFFFCWCSWCYCCLFVSWLVVVHCYVWISSRRVFLNLNMYLLCFVTATFCSLFWTLVVKFSILFYQCMSFFFYFFFIIFYILLKKTIYLVFWYTWMCLFNLNLVACLFFLLSSSYFLFVLSWWWWYVCLFFFFPFWLEFIPPKVIVSHMNLIIWTSPGWLSRCWRVLFCYIDMMWSTMKIGILFD